MADGEIVINNSEFDDNELQREVEDYENNILNDKQLLKEMKRFKPVFDAFYSEEKYTKVYRHIFSITIIVFMILNFAAILVAAFLAIKRDIGIITVAVILISLIAEIVLLLGIILKFLFNRKDNKILEIILNYLKMLAKYDVDIKQIDSYDLGIDTYINDYD